MKLWTRIINHGVDLENLNWDTRNLRFMNAMAFILSASMVMFTCFMIAFQIYETLPLLIVSFVLCSSYFLVAWKLGTQVAKIYFSVVPVLLVAMFSIFAVGEVGNDKYYLFASAIVPLVLFRKKWSYLPLFLLNVLFFCLIGFAQKHITPLSQISSSELDLYRAMNVMMMFIFIYFSIQLFKKEIFTYQQEVEKQKEIIEEKNEEVRQSIEYAKKIQEAILPSPSFQQEHLPNSFILYKPKDIVAGDFYWMERSGDLIFFAAADCTGHGVPGAMVSVVCHNALNQALNEFGFTKPSDILNKTRELVIQTFVRSDRQVKDGMDIGLCAYNKKTNELQFSGANNSLYHLTNNELIEIKADKQPIGNFENAAPFKNHSIQLNTGDTIYLYTDGFADQFGGDKGKKYKYKPFKQFLEKLRESPIQSQAVLIEEEFEQWKGDLEQVDDVCIIGVKF